jgi:hypothetical protein
LDKKSVDLISTASHGDVGGNPAACARIVPSAKNQHRTVLEYGRHRGGVQEPHGANIGSVSQVAVELFF